MFRISWSRKQTREYRNTALITLGEDTILWRFRGQSIQSITYLWKESNDRIRCGRAVIAGQLLMELGPRSGMDPRGSGSTDLEQSVNKDLSLPDVTFRRTELQLNDVSDFPFSGAYAIKILYVELRTMTRHHVFG